MKISFSCNHCGKSHTIDGSHAGKNAKCDGCQGMIRVPQLPATNAPPPVFKPAAPDSPVPEKTHFTSSLVPKSAKSRYPVLGIYVFAYRWGAIVMALLTALSLVLGLFVVSDYGPFAVGGLVFIFICGAVIAGTELVKVIIDIEKGIRELGLKDSNG